MSSLNFTPNTSCGPCLYCGKSSKNKPHELLCCGLCRRPLHISCLKNGSPQTSFIGDNFFWATCSSCTIDGKDCVRRADMSTIQVLLLLMYNLHLNQEHTSKSGFFHWKVHVSSLVNKHWKELESPDSHRRRKRMLQAALSGQLAHYVRYFQNGQAELGEGGWYKLIEVVPPAVVLMNTGSDQGEKKLTRDFPSELESTTKEAKPSTSTTPKTVFSIKKEQDHLEESNYSSSSQDMSGAVMTESESPPNTSMEGEHLMGMEEEEGVTHFHHRLHNLKSEAVDDEEMTVGDYEMGDQEENLFVDEKIKEEEPVTENVWIGETGEDKVEMQPSLIPAPSFNQPVLLYHKEEMKKHCNKNDFEDNPSSPVGAEDDEGPPPPSGRASSPSVELLLNDSAAAVFERRDRSPQENSSNSQGEGPAPALQKKPNRRKKNPSVILTDAQERALAQWLEVEGEFIYNRGKTAYKDKAKIARAWEEQGAKLEPPVSGTDLRTWFSSLRSRYGRLTNTVSGQATGSKRHTDRERWILELFPFLKAHIVRQHKTATLGLPTDDDTPATRTTAATTTTTTTTTATTTGVGVSHGDPDTPSPASEDEEVVVVPAIKVPRKPRTRKHPPMKPGAAIDSVIDGAKHFLSEFKELSGDRDTEAARHFLESLLPMLLKVGPSLMPIFRMEITACLRKYEQATKQGAEMASHDLKYHIINSEYCPAPSPPKAQPQQQQQQLLMLQPQQLQQLQQLQQQLQQPQQQQPQLVPQLPATFPATFPSIRQQGQPAVTSVTPQQLQLLQQQYLLRSPSTSSIGLPANNTTDLNMSLLMDMQLPGDSQASTASTPANAPPQQSTTTLHMPTSSADF